MGTASASWSLRLLSTRVMTGLVCRRMKATYHRRVLGVEEPVPSKDQVWAEEQKKRPTAASVRHSKALGSGTSDFNMTMGEITLGKGLRKKWIAVEGARFIEDAIFAGFQLEKLYLLRTTNYKNKLDTVVNALPEKLKEVVITAQNKTNQEASQSSSSSPSVQRVSLDAMQTWSSVTTVPGVIGIFKKPAASEIYFNKRWNQQQQPELNISELALPVTVLCDNLREPGNLGSILRTAAGAGCSQVYLTEGCVDPWNMKVLRGACGAHFRLPLTPYLTDDSIKRLLQEALKSNSSSVEQPFGILICDANPTQTRTKLTDIDTFNDGKSGSGSVVVPYTSMVYTKFSHCFVIVGSETEGVGDSRINIIKEIAKQNTGAVEVHSVNIPLSNQIDSLNAANALGVVLFEIRRQQQTKK